MKRTSSLVLFAITLSACGTDLEATGPEPTGSTPVYYGDIERIVRDNCIDCHSTSPDRLAPFALTSYEDTVAAADDWPLAFAVTNRIMPPYYAKDDGSCQTFHGNKWLTDGEIARFLEWTNGDRLMGDPASSVAAPPVVSALPRVDQTLDIGTAYTPDAALDDDYRCFVVDPIGANKFVTGVYVQPDNASVVHHVIVFTLPSDAAEADVIQRDANAAGPGYPCTNGATDLGTGFLAGWAPGEQANIFPDGTGIAAGTRKVVIQMHYNLANSNGQPDRTTIQLMLADTVTTPAMIVALRGNVNLSPGQDDATATGTITLPTTVSSARLWGGLMHMHTRGTGAEVVVERDSSSCLFDLDGWSFHWQHFYWYEAPVALHGGDRLRVTCHYDTTGETGTVTWGEGTADEMCLAGLYVSQ